MDSILYHLNTIFDWFDTSVLYQSHTWSFFILVGFNLNNAFLNLDFFDTIRIIFANLLFKELNLCDAERLQKAVLQNGLLA